MLIDWFTVGAQALNFLILVWLMKRFLYRPVLDAVDAREKRIATELADADKKKAEAATERDEFQRKNADIDQQRDKLLREAKDAANVERLRLLEQARAAADALKSKRQESLENEANGLSQELCRRAQQEVFAIARKALADLSTTTLEASMSEVFVSRLRALDGPAKTKIVDALKSAPAPAIVRSAFALPTAQHDAIQQALNDMSASEIKIQFVVAPDIVSGIELGSNGEKVAWSIADYLASLTKAVDDLILERDGRTSDIDDDTGNTSPQAEVVDTDSDLKSVERDMHGPNASASTARAQ